MRPESGPVGAARRGTDSARRNAGSRASAARTGVASSRSRFAARAAGARRRPWRLTAWVAALLLIVVALAWVVEGSPLLVVRTVRVHGVPADASAAILRLADVPMGRPLARVDTDAIRGRVLSSGRLDGVTVDRAWPGTVVITARPRVPVLAVKNSKGQVEVVDRTGFAYATVTAAPEGVPVVSAVQDPPSQDALAAGIAVLEALTPQERGRVSRVTISSASDVTLEVGGRTVLWGGAEDSDLKARVLGVLLTQKGSTINVSAPRSPVIS